MDQQGEQSMIQAGCSISGIPIAFQDASGSGIEVVQSTDGNYRIMQSTNGQPFAQQMVQPQFRQVTMQPPNIVFETQMQQHQMMQQQVQPSVQSFVFQDAGMQQQQHQMPQGVQKIFLANNSPGKVMVGPQFLKLQGNRFLLVTPNQAQAISNIQDFQQKHGINVPVGTPPKVNRGRGRMITIDGRVTTTTSPSKPVIVQQMATPPKPQFPQQHSATYVSPPKLQVRQSPQQQSPSRPVAQNVQIQQQSPSRPVAQHVQIQQQSPSRLANPQQIQVQQQQQQQQSTPQPRPLMSIKTTPPPHINGPRPSMTSPSKPPSTPLPKTASRPATPQGKLIVSGNKSFSIINSSSCKAAPLGSLKAETIDENKLRPSQIKPHFTQQSQHSYPPQRKIQNSPQTSTVVNKPPPATPPPAPTVQLPSTLVARAEPEAPVDTPKFIPGKLALCKFCGYMSQDFNKCQRCKRKLPEDVKSCVDSSGLTPKSTPSPKPIYSKLTLVSTKGLVPLGASASSPKPKPAEQQKLTPRPPILKNKKPTLQPTPKRTKRVEEPVILTISDDEDDQAGKEKPAAAPVPVSAPKEVTPSNAEALRLQAKEPTLKEIQQPEEITSLTLGLENNMLENYRKGLAGLAGLVAANIKCRTVRIGSYKVEPLDSVLFCPEGVRISVPHPETKVGVVIEIPRGNISAVLSHLGRSLPVFFLYIKSATSQRIRDLLGMKDSTREPFFDPESSNETHKRITMLPEKVSDEAKLMIKRIFSKDHGKDIMTNIESKEANSILVKASPIANMADLKSQTPQKQTRSQDAPKVVKEPTKVLVTYPKPPLKGGIPITTDDYLCLGEEQFLNDVIIDFYLKYLLNNLTEDDQARTHIFSSFFYRRLTTRQITRKSETPAEKKTPAEQRHARVKSWTKNVDIFDKDFVFIPINEHAHWFLAVICFPNQDGIVKFSDGLPITLEALRQQKQQTMAKVTVQAPGNQAVTQFTIGATTVTVSANVTPQTVNLLKEKAKTVISLDEDEGSDRDEAEGDEEEFGESADENETESAEAAKPEAEPQTGTMADVSKYPPNAIKQPCILIFDSLPNNRRSRTVATLRDYLKIEYKAKKGKDRDFNKDSIRGALPKVPQQNNFTDCGIFMLQYAESFFENPIRDFNLPLKNLNQWFDETTIRGKREGIAKLIQQLMAEEKVDIKLPELTFPKPLTSSGIAVSVTAEPLPPLPPDDMPPPPPPPPPEAMEAPLVATQSESVGADIISHSVVVPEDVSAAPPPAASLSEVVVGADEAHMPPTQQPQPAAPLNDSLDPENMSHCIELVDALFGDDPELSGGGVSGVVLEAPTLKRGAEPSGEPEVSPKRVC